MNEFNYEKFGFKNISNYHRYNNLPPLLVSQKSKANIIENLENSLKPENKLQSEKNIPKDEWEGFKKINYEIKPYDMSKITDLMKKQEEVINSQNVKNPASVSSNSEYRNPNIVKKDNFKNDLDNTINDPKKLIENQNIDVNNISLNKEKDGFSTFSNKKNDGSINYFLNDYLSKKNEYNNTDINSKTFETNPDYSKKKEKEEIIDIKNNDLQNKNGLFANTYEDNEKRDYQKELIFNLQNQNEILVLNNKELLNNLKVKEIEMDIIKKELLNKNERFEDKNLYMKFENQKIILEKQNEELFKTLKLKQEEINKLMKINQENVVNKIDNSFVIKLEEQNKSLEKKNQDLFNHLNFKLEEIKNLKNENFELQKKDTNEIALLETENKKYKKIQEELEKKIQFLEEEKKGNLEKITKLNSNEEELRLEINNLQREKNFEIEKKNKMINTEKEQNKELRNEIKEMKIHMEKANFNNLQEEQLKQKMSSLEQKNIELLKKIDSDFFGLNEKEKKNENLIKEINRLKNELNDKNSKMEYYLDLEKNLKSLKEKNEMQDKYISNLNSSFVDYKEIKNQMEFLKNRNEVLEQEQERFFENKKKIIELLENISKLENVIFMKNNEIDKMTIIQNRNNFENKKIQNELQNEKKNLEHEIDKLKIEIQNKNDIEKNNKILFREKQELIIDLKNKTSLIENKNKEVQEFLTENEFLKQEIMKIKSSVNSQSSLENYYNNLVKNLQTKITHLKEDLENNEIDKNNLKEYIEKKNQELLFLRNSSNKKKEINDKNLVSLFLHKNELLRLHETISTPNMEETKNFGKQLNDVKIKNSPINNESRKISSMKPVKEGFNKNYHNNEEAHKDIFSDDDLNDSNITEITRLKEEKNKLLNFVDSYKINTKELEGKINKLMENFSYLKDNNKAKDKEIEILKSQVTTSNKDLILKVKVLDTENKKLNEMLLEQMIKYDYIKNRK